MITDKYRNYLNSNKWLKKRDRILKLHNRRCQSCSSDKNLIIHHGTYDRIFHEYDSDLFVLCNRCHTEYHESIGNQKTTNQLTKDYINIISTSLGDNFVPFIEKRKYKNLKKEWFRSIGASKVKKFKPSKKKVSIDIFTNQKENSEIGKKVLIDIREKINNKPKKKIEYLIID